MWSSVAPFPTTFYRISMMLGPASDFLRRTLVSASAQKFGATVSPKSAATLGSTWWSRPNFAELGPNLAERFVVACATDSLRELQYRLRSRGFGVRPRPAHKKRSQLYTTPMTRARRMTGMLSAVQPAKTPLAVSQPHKGLALGVYGGSSLEALEGREDWGGRWHQVARTWALKGWTHAVSPERTSSFNVSHLEYRQRMLTKSAPTASGGSRQEVLEQCSPSFSPQNGPMYTNFEITEQPRSTSTTASFLRVMSTRRPPTSTQSWSTFDVSRKTRCAVGPKSARRWPQEG